MKKTKVVSLILTATMTFSVIPGCVSSKEIGTLVAPVESTIMACETEAIIDDLTSYYDYLDKLPRVDSSEILNNPESYSKEEVAKISYDNLKNKKIDINNLELQKELDNVAVYSAWPMGLSDAEYEQAVGLLASTLNERQNAFSVYYPLTLETHLKTCPEKHEINEFGKTVCPVITKKLENINFVDIEDILDENFINDLSYLRIKNAALQNGISIEIYLNELENLVTLAKNPTDIYDNTLWYSLFGSLDVTLTEEESLYETYIKLAYQVHNLLYPNDVLELPEDLKQIRD